MVEETKKLNKFSETDYGNHYKDHVLEQYKIYVQSAEKISERRQHANNFFITINTALISLIGVFLKIETLNELFWLKILLSFVGVIICVIFWYLLRSYRQINSGKFKVIHEIENILPLALYRYEWETLGKGKNKKLYYPFSHIELYIPWVFGIIYVIVGIMMFA